MKKGLKFRKTTSGLPQTKGWRFGLKIGLSIGIGIILVWYVILLGIGKFLVSFEDEIIQLQLKIYYD